MNPYAFALVALVIVAMMVVVAIQARENRDLRADLRRHSDRLLNALIADDARELSGLDEHTVAPAVDAAAHEFVARERARRRREAAAPAQRPPGAVVGME